MGLQELILIVVVILVITGFCILIYKVLGRKPFKENIAFNITVIVIAYICLSVLVSGINYFTTPTQHHNITENIENVTSSHLSDVSGFLTTQIILNNNPNYNKEIVASNHKSPLVTNEFKLYWRAYFLYFIEDLDSTIITKTKHLGERRNEVESAMLGKYITQASLDEFDKFENDFTYKNEVTINGIKYPSKELIDSLLSWHFYNYDDKDYGLKVFEMIE